MNRRLSFGLASAGLLAIAASTATAQTESTTPQVSEEWGVEEIVVTARRRDESLQDIPQTVNAVTSESIEKLNLLKFEDVQAVVPGLTLASNNTGFGAAASMRGVSFEAQTLTSPTVEFYLNDAPAEANLVFQSMYDIGQIEVLRGPQGTLRGRASPSGAITLTTRKANLSEYGGYAQVSGTHQDSYNLQGAVNLPIFTDRLAVRIAGVYDENEYDGVRSVNSDVDPKQQTKSGRITVGFAPTDMVDASVSYQYLKRDLRSYVHVTGPGSLGDSTNPALGAGYNGPALDPEDRRSVQDEPGNLVHKYDAIDAQINWHVAGQRVSYVGAYRKQDIDSAYTVDAGNLNPGVEVFQPVMSEYRQRSHELRISSEERIADKFDYTAGLFYANTDSDPTHSQQAANYNPGALGRPDSLGTIYPQYIAQTLIDRKSHIEEQSAFASVTWHITEVTELTLGGRYIVNKSDEFTGLSISPSLVSLPASLCTTFPQLGGSTATSPFPGYCDIPVQNLAVFAGSPNEQLAQLAQLAQLGPRNLNPQVNKSKNKPFVYNVQLSHRFNDDFMAYANVGSSWRRGVAVLGIFPVPSDPVVNDLVDHPPEKSRSYELGFKADFLDDRARVNLAVYHQNYDGLIFRSTQPITYIGDRGAGPQLIQFQFINSADAVVNGVDLDAAFQITPRWNVTLAASYADGHVDDDFIPCNEGPALNPADPQGRYINLCKSDDTISAATKWNASLQSEYSVPFSDNVDGYIRGLYTYYPKNKEQEFFQAESYGLLNLFMGVRSPDGVWDVTLFAKNAFNEKETLTVERSLGAFADAMYNYPLFANIPENGIYGKAGYLPTRITPRREIGLQVRYAFGSR